MSGRRESKEETEVLADEEDELNPSDRYEDGTNLQQHHHQNKNKKKKEEREEEVEENKEGNDERKTSGRAKHLLLLPFRKFGKLRSAARKKRTPRQPPFPFADDDVVSSKGCYLCFMMQPPALPSDDYYSPLRPPTIPGAGSAPTIKKSSSSYYDFLKSLIENNDFYSPDCNVHRDVRPNPTDT